MPIIPRLYRTRMPETLEAVDDMLRRDYDPDKQYIVLFNEFCFGSRLPGEDYVVSSDGDNRFHGYKPVADSLNNLLAQSIDLPMVWFFMGSIVEDTELFTYTTMPVIHQGRLVAKRRKMQYHNIKENAVDPVPPSINLEEYRRKYQKKEEQRIKELDQIARRETMESLTVLKIDGKKVLPALCNETDVLYEHRRYIGKVDIIVEAAYDHLSSAEVYMSGLWRAGIVGDESFLVKSDYEQPHSSGIFKVRADGYRAELEPIEEIS